MPALASRHRRSIWNFLAEGFPTPLLDLSPMARAKGTTTSTVTAESRRRGRGRKDKSVDNQ
jgi:hypothetical protein